MVGWLRFFLLVEEVAEAKVTRMQMQVAVVAVVALCESLCLWPETPLWSSVSVELVRPQQAPMEATVLRLTLALLLLAVEVVVAELRREALVVTVAGVVVTAVVVAEAEAEGLVSLELVFPVEAVELCWAILVGLRSVDR